MATKAEKIAALKRTIRLVSLDSPLTGRLRYDLRILEELITDLGGDARNIPGSPGKEKDDDTANDHFPIG